MIKTAPFSLRDTIQYVLPVLIGTALFFPYAAEAERLEFVFLLAALFSYVLHPPLDYLARKTLSAIPFFGKEIKKQRERNDFWVGNWDHDRLFYTLMNDKEREYLYLTAGYGGFHRVTAFILLIYFFVQLFLVFNSTVILSPGFGFTASFLWESRTPFLGSWSMPSLVVAVISGVLFYFSMNNYLTEAADLLTIQDRFAEKYHAQHGNLTKNIWGQVTCDSKPVKGATVKLLKSDGSCVESLKTDRSGYYRFGGYFELAVTEPLTVALDCAEWSEQKMVRSDAGSVPQVDFQKGATRDE